MKTLTVLIASLCASTLVMADDNVAQRGVAPKPAAKVIMKSKESKAVRLSEEQLDKIVAAGADVSAGHGTMQTIIENNNPNFVQKNNHNHLVCINCL